MSKKLSEKAVEARYGSEFIESAERLAGETDLDRWERDREKPARVEINYRPGEDTVAAEVFAECGWTGDPRTGESVVLPSGREVLNPVPVAPPVGYVAGPTLMELMDQMLRRRLDLLADDEEIDSPEELEDFGEDVDEFPSSPYEFVDMRTDFPGNTMGEEGKPGEAAGAAPASAPSGESVGKPDVK